MNTQTKTVLISNRLEIPALFAIALLAMVSPVRLRRPDVCPKTHDDTGEFPESDIALQVGGNWAPNLGAYDDTAGMAVFRRLKKAAGAHTHMLSELWERRGKEVAERVMYGMTTVPCTVEGDETSFLPEAVADRIATLLEEVEQNHSGDRRHILVSTIEQVGEGLHEWASSEAMQRLILESDARHGIDKFGVWNDEAVAIGLTLAADRLYQRFEDALNGAVSPFKLESLQTFDGGRVIVAPRRLTQAELAKFAKANPEIAGKVEFVVFTHDAGELAGCSQLEPVLVDAFGEITEKGGRQRRPWPAFLGGYLADVTWPGLEPFLNTVSETEFEKTLRQLVRDTAGTIANVRVAKTSVFGASKALITSDEKSSVRLARELRRFTERFEGKERKQSLTRLPRMRR